MSDEKPEIEETPSPVGKTTVKKPYKAPTLLVLGSFRQITGATGWYGNLDGGRVFLYRRTRN